jgi:hypothetical protein
MTPAVYDQLLQVLRREPQKLRHLHALAHDAGSLWSVDQVLLMFACMDGVTIDSPDAANPTIRLGERSVQDELADAIADVVRSQGRPVPAAQVLQMLPRKFTTSAEQIKKIAREANGLKVIGPGLIALE